MAEREAARPGDKVVVLRGPRQGSRGVIQDVRSDAVVITFGDAVDALPTPAVLNYSAAARKAWRTRPDRAVGRPRNPSVREKRMVSLRIENELWDGLGRAVKDGVIKSREAAVNEWLREKLVQMGARPDEEKRGE